MWTLSRHVDASVEAVWDVLTDLDAWPRWGLTVSRATVDDGDVLTLGVRGRVWTPVGVALPFAITEFVPHRSWGWTVAGVPATRHGVDPDGDGSRVWMSAPLWAPAYLPVLDVALRRIDAMATTAPT